MTFADIPRNPTPRTLRQFAIIWLIFFGGWGVWQWVGKSRPTLGIALIVGALAVGCLGLIRPPLVRRVFVGYMILAFPLGWTVSNLALAVLFFGIFSPVAMILRLTGRDPMMRRKPSRGSYWLEKRQSRNTRDYFHQY